MNFRCIDLHAAGEPSRIVIGGMPEIPGDTMMEKRESLMNNYDYIRKILLQEPRGYPCQNANIIFPSKLPGVLYGYVILEQNKIYPLMSGHNTICVVTALIQSQLISLPISDEITTHEFNLEAPAGIIPIRVACRNNKVLQVTLQTSPSYVRHHGVIVNVPTLSEVEVDVVYSGMWYCVVDISKFTQQFLKNIYSLNNTTTNNNNNNSNSNNILSSQEELSLLIVPSNGKILCRLGEMIKVACREQYPVCHEILSYTGCDILVYMQDPLLTCGSNHHRTNTVVMSNGELIWSRPDTWTGMLDRSPCGTGTAAVMTKLYFEGQLPLKTNFIHESILGTQFTGQLIDVTKVGSYTAVIPEISGRAYITQYCDVVLDEDDPFPEGFTVGDIWC